MLGDSLSICGMFGKGRSSASALMGVTRRMAAHALVFNTPVCFRWIPSEWNVADGPSRLVPRPYRPKRLGDHVAQDFLDECRLLRATDEDAQLEPASGANPAAVVGASAWSARLFISAARAFAASRSTSSVLMRRSRVRAEVLRAACWILAAGFDPVTFL